MPSRATEYHDKTCLTKDFISHFPNLICVFCIHFHSYFQFSKKLRCIWFCGKLEVVTASIISVVQLITLTATDLVLN